MPKFVPLLISATLVTPISAEEPIHLESILYATRFRREPELYGTPLDCIAYDRGMPLASAGIMVEHGEMGVRHGSTTVVRALNMRSTDVFKIKADEKTPAIHRRINDMSPYRNRLRDYRTLIGVSEVYFLAKGDEDGVSDLLSSNPSLGALRSRGMGHVSKWSVEEADFDADTMPWFSNGKLMRRLPAEFVLEALGKKPDGAKRRQDRLDPPFWAASTEVDVMAPMLRSMIVTPRDAVALIGR